MLGKIRALVSYVLQAVLGQGGGKEARFSISGQVRELESQRGLPGLVVSAFDKDLLFDDLLGQVGTDGGGRFQLAYAGRSFQKLFDRRPDIYLRVKTWDGRGLHIMDKEVRFEAGHDEHFILEIPHDLVVAAGLDTSATVEAIPEALKVLTCLEGQSDSDPLVAAIRRDLAGKASALELMKSYIQELEGELDSNAAPFAKLAKLFSYGSTPERLEGHHYGVTLGLKSGDRTGIWAEYDNLLGLAWSSSLGKAPPWVGKSFLKATAEDLRYSTEGYEQGAIPTYAGTNHFNQIEDSPLNVVSLAFLTFWMDLKDAPGEERAQYGYEKNGGSFVARRARSVYPGTDREVFSLNYRWPKLGNLPPLRYLIDEVVEVAGGFYLGQLLFATRKLFSAYDPRLPDSEYGYEHFGYFLLMDERWRGEATRLFPHVGIPYIGRADAGPRPEKFSAFTFAEPIDGNCDDEVLAAIRQDVQGRETILDLLGYYSDALRADPSADSPYFVRLHELFNRGVAPEAIEGFYRGALISFRNEGLLRVFKLNVLNLTWGLARLFTPWTGKIFEGIGPERLGELTDGGESGAVPTFWGANTYSLRSTRKRIAGEAMRLAGVWTEEATDVERRLFGVDLKSFFFIGRRGASVNEDNQGKKVFQLNYRWPKLRTFPPDNYCIDEVVQIAEGLYLGQLTYATEALKKYDPARDPSEYKYRVFGYFLLMDEDWHRRRMRIGFDLDNT